MTSVQSSKFLICKDKLEYALTFLICPLAFFSPHSTVVPLILLGLLHIPNIDCQSWLTSNRAIHAAKAAMIYALMTAFWSVDPLNSIFVGLRVIALISLGYAWMKGNKRPELIMPLFYGFIFALTLMVTDAFLDYQWPKLTNKTISKAYVQLGLTLSLALFPLNVWFWKRRKRTLGLFLSLISIWAVKFSSCDSAQLAIVTGLLGGFALYTLGNRILTLTKIFLITLNLTLPLIFHYSITDSFIETMTKVKKFDEDSYIHRLLIWREATKLIKERPLLGYGLDSSRNDAVGGSEIIFSYKNHNDQPVKIHSKKIPVHPHNYILQWWIEFGLMGIVLGNIFIWYLFKRMAFVQDKVVKAGYFGLFCASAVIAGINLGFWQNWWLAVLFIMIGLMRPLNQYKAS